VWRGSSFSVVFLSFVLLVPSIVVVCVFSVSIFVRNGFHVVFVVTCEYLSPQRCFWWCLLVVVFSIVYFRML